MQRLLVLVIVAGLGLTGASACTSGSGSPARTESPSIAAPSTTAHATAVASDDASATNPSAPSAGRAAASTPPSPATLIGYVRAGRAVAGADFQVGAAGPGESMRPTPGVEEFTTPSGNVACGILSTGTEVTCSVKDYSYATPPRPASCQLNYAPGWVSLGSAGVTRALCLGGPPFAPASRTLPYGSTLTEGAMTCRSEAAFLACADTSTGHGFAVNRTALTTY